MISSIKAAEVKVRVSNWMYGRTVLVEDHRILMEVARTSNNCHHCPTCRRRVNTIEQALNGSPYVWKWEFLDRGGMWLSLSRPAGEDPVALLRQATGLALST